MITYRGNPTRQYEQGSTMKVRITGLDEVVKDLLKTAEKVKVNKSKLMQNLVYDGVQIAKEEVPVDTGELKESIHGFLNPEATRGEIIAGTDHALFVEFGTGLRGEATSPIGNDPVNYVYDYHNRNWLGNAANPFMHRTAVRLKEDIEKRTKEFLDKVTE